MSASNTTLALVVTMGGAVLAWTGITDPPGGLVGAVQRVIAHQPAAGPPKAPSTPLALAAAFYTGGTAGASSGAPSAGAPAGVWGHYPSGGYHPGLDFPCPPGTPVHAVADGVVVRSGWDTTGYGMAVEVRMSNGWEYLLGHNSRLLVNVGQHVTAGQVIAVSGSTGHSTGPHVHLGVKDAHGWFDFTPYLSDGAPSGGITYT